MQISVRPVSLIIRVFFEYTDKSVELCIDESKTEIFMGRSIDARGDAVQRYVDILTNGGFKALFGDMNNKEAVMLIMNSLLPQHRKVVDIEYMPTEHQGQIADNKEYHYDFMCRDEDGAVFIVEMQNYGELHWFKRCVSYAARAYDRQNRRGEEYDVPPVYLIGLMGTDIPHPDPSLWKDVYLAEYTFREKTTGEVLDETIFIIFAELARFKKRCEACETDIDRMMFILKNMGKLKNRPEWLQKEVYTKIFEACEIARFDESKRIKYEQDMYDQRRLNGELAFARRKGIEEGLAEGKAESIRETALKMLELSMSIDVISSVTGLTEEQINELRTE